MAQNGISETETNIFACPHWDTCNVHRCDICAFAKTLTYKAIKSKHEPYLAYSCETFGQYETTNLICGSCPLKVNCMEEKEKRQAYMESLREMEVLVSLVQEKIVESKGWFKKRM